MFEIEVLEVDKTLSDRFGVNIAKQAGAAVVPPLSGLPSPGTTSTFTDQQLTSLNPTSYLFTLPTSVLLDFLRSESTTKTLANPPVPVVNNKQAKINIGDKVPILLSSSSTIPGVTPGTIPTQSTITSIEFKDTGVKLTVEPVIHLNQDVTLKLQLEVTRLGDLVDLGNGQKQFKFGTRTAETSLSLKDGESVVLAGLIQPEDRTTVTKVRGLGDIPVLGEMFKSTTRDVVTTDVILTITPHIVRAMELPSMDDQAFWSGTEEAYGLKQLFPDGGIGRGILGAVPASPAPALPGAPSPVPEAPAPPGGQVPRPPPLGVLSVLPPDRTASVGEEIRLDVTVTNIEDLAEGTLTVSYDPKVLEFRQAFEGEFLKREGTATVVTAANPATGTVVVQLTRGE